jgi:hypothetical protein
MMLGKPVAHRIDVDQRIGTAMRMRMLVAISRVGIFLGGNWCGSVVCWPTHGHVEVIVERAERIM